MPAPARTFWKTLAAVLLLACIAGIVYAHLQSIPALVAGPLLAAILVELALYLAPGFECVRTALEARFSPRRLALWMTLAALLPYTLYSLPTGKFDWIALAQVGVLAGVISAWYAVLPPRPACDLLFVGVMAAAALSKVFARIYLPATPELRADFLGQLMWIRTGVLAMLVLRHAPGTGFGFLPARPDFKIGFYCFLGFVPFGVVLGRALDFASFHPRPGEWWVNLLLAAATFAGMLWVVALSEEFFFRGLLQQWLCGWMGNRWAGLAAASVLFGLAHLPYRAFPNWRFAILATVAGGFYGLAYLRAGNIRAAMVAHALVNTTWRILFTAR